MPYRRSVLLVNKRFQLRFCFYVCSWLFALSLVYPIIIYNLFDYFIGYLSADPYGPALAGLQKTRQEMIKLLISLQAIFLSMTFLISIFMSHKIAGPIYKLQKFFNEAMNGNFSQTLAFRKRDHFQDLAQDYNGMMQKVRDIFGKTHEKTAQAIVRIEAAAGQGSPEVRAALEEALSALKEVQETVPH